MDQAALEQFVTDLAAGDPAVRDDGAFAGLAAAVSEDRLTTVQRAWLGDRMVARFSHPEPFARSFAPLILAVLADTWSTNDGEWPPEWSDALLVWWPTESDLRGHDPTVGWIHAVAHGADAVGTLGATRLAPADRLLSAVAERITAPTDLVWQDQEDDRVAAAVVGILLGNPQAHLEPLLEPIAAMFATGRPGPVPAAATNAMHTLRSLYVALGNTVLDPKTQEPQHVPNAPSLQESIAVTLQATTPWLFTAGRESAG